MARRVATRDPAQGQLEFAIVSAQLTIEAMRDSGYKDTDHALAELIDNSIEAKSELIEIVAVETPPDQSKAYARPKISEIAVADNGEGMNAIVLRRALKFGDGTRKDRREQGIGRFGVGLPQSSISQCKRVDVWTWTNGVDNALRCYLDLDEINATGRQVVPEPCANPVPDRWRRVLSNVSERSGTLVVWSSLDRARWSGGTKTLDRTGELCGRIYRKFLTKPRCPIQIEMILASDEAGLLLEMERKSCLPNDPLYLIVPSSTPEPFGDRPMFKEYNTRSWQVPVHGVVGKIKVRCTMALPDAINEEKSSLVWPKSYAKAGDAPWGKHANRNRGVSIVRAGRELELSLAWVNNYEPEERWWSVEVEFDPILDEIFGVVNNKQHAHAFVSGAGFDEKEVPEPGETFGEFKQRLKETEDSREHLVEVWVWIESQILQMRKERKIIMKGTGPGPRHPQTGRQPADSATDVLNDQAEHGEIGETDRAPEITPEEKEDDIARSLEGVRVPQETARDWARETVRNDRRVLLKAVNLGHRDAFFGVESVNDVIEVWLNDRHPVHEHLINVLSLDTGDQDTAELAARLESAAFALEMLLIAWARHEDKSPVELRRTLEDVRMDWGREARKFLDVIES